jgi:cysteinyl-tRNA synthetase
MLSIFNNLNKKKQVFKPIDSQNVRMYVCGMTVYDFCHIGHARALVVFDMVNRYLRQLYDSQHVTYVRNITDIDDKIIKRAEESKQTTEDLTHTFIMEMNKDADALGVLRPDYEPKATQHIDDIVSMIEKLITKGYAYHIEKGDVYYNVRKFESYGALSGKKTDELRTGIRVEVDQSKRDPLDFVLWKAAKPNEPSWDSPWGKGRPGWHIECSAMSTHCLGDHFDIHGGGLDLQFPHHENEIAQSEAATGEKFVNVWMHNGHVRIDDEKMSKSLGNFFTIREVLKKYDPEVLRFFFLSSHYRSPLNYSDVHLENAKAGLTTLYTALRGLESKVDLKADDEMTIRFMNAMDDDFNTPEAIAVLYEAAKECNRLHNIESEQTNQVAGNLIAMAGLLGLLQREPDDYLQGGVQGEDHTELLSVEIDRLIIDRESARARKDWAESDRIRDELAAQGIVLEDGGKGTTWRRE